MSKFDDCPYCGSALSQAQYDGQFCGCGWPNVKTYVIALNDFAHEIHTCYSEDMMHDRCNVLKQEYLQQHPEVNPVVIRFHGREVPTTHQPMIHVLRQQECGRVNGHDFYAVERIGDATPREMCVICGLEREVES